MPDNGTKMIECESCQKWFHMNYVSLDMQMSYKQVKVLSVMTLSRNFPILPLNVHKDFE